MRKENSTNAINEEYLMNICDFHYVLQLIGGRWKAQILFAIAQGYNRFSLLKKEMPNISDQVLGRQLKSLEKDDLIYKKPIHNSIPPGVEYIFTDKANSLIHPLRELCHWAEDFRLKDNL
jgi:DNA-binding HxlR family transcriptional regulator